MENNSNERGTELTSFIFIPHQIHGRALKIHPENGIKDIKRLTTQVNLKDFN